MAVLLPATACGHSGPAVVTRSEKPTAPVTLRVGAVAPGRLGRAFTVVAVASPRVPAESLSLTARFAGVAVRAGRGAASATWYAVPAGRSHRLAIAVVARHAATGALTITARVVAGGVAQTQAAVVDVLATRDEVLAGTNGLQQLQLRHLDHELAAGRITRAEYDQRRARVLGGGATEGP